MRLGERLKYKARRYIYQIEQEAYVAKNKLDKENEKAQKIYNQDGYEKKIYQVDDKQTKDMSLQSNLDSKLKADTSTYDYQKKYDQYQEYNQYHKYDEHYKYDQHQEYDEHHKYDQPHKYNQQKKYNQQGYSGQNYNYPNDTEDNVYMKSPPKKHKDSWYYESTYSNGQYENDQKDYYDVYPEKYTGKSQNYSVSDEGYLGYQEKEYNKDKKIDPRKKITTKLDELEDYLQQALSGIKKGKR